MKQISSVDIFYLVKEFQVLVNQRVESFYFEDMTFFIRVYVRGVGHKYLTNKMSKYIYLGDSKIDSSHPNNFISFLRKYLKSSFIREISQVGDERIIKIVFEQKIGEDIRRFNLYLELFANGNIILCDSENIIMNSLTKKKYKDRVVMNKEVYELPPAQNLSLSNIDVDILKKEILETDLVLVKFLAIKFGIGGKFAEEICFRAGFDKNLAPSEVDVKNLVGVLKTVKGFDVEAYVLKKDDTIKDFFPFKFESVSDLVRVSSFNGALRDYFLQHVEVVDIREKNFAKELKKLQNRVKKQEESKKKIIVDYEENNLIGTKIFENYALIEELLTSINSVAKEKGWDYVKDKIKSDKRLSKVISKLDYKNDSIVLNLE